MWLLFEICSSSFQNRKTPVLESLFLIKLQASACTFIDKETLAQVFSCEFCEIYKNTFFTEHFQETDSVPYLELSPASLMELFWKDSFYLFSQKRFIVDVCLGSKNISVKSETFKMKLMSSKSWQLLQRAAFFVCFYQ